MKTVRKGMAIGAVLILSAGVAMAADQLLTGRKAGIKNPAGAPAKNRLSFKSIDPTITAPLNGDVLDDPTLVGGSLTYTATGAGLTPSTDTIPLPKAGWTSPKPLAYRYSDGVCKAKVRENTAPKLDVARAVCIGAIVPSLDLVRIDPVKFKLALGGHRYCTSFGDSSVVRNGSNGKGFSARNSLAGSSCSPSGAFLDASALF